MIMTSNIEQKSVLQKDPYVQDGTGCLLQYRYMIKRREIRVGFPIIHNM